MEIKTVSPSTLKKWLDNEDILLIDVREPAEHASQKIPGSLLKPLGSICCSDIPDSNKKIVIYCQEGFRSNSACQRLIVENNEMDLYNLEGGISAWQNEALPLEIGGKKVLPLHRQVQLIIGLSTLTFGLFGYFVNPVFSLGAAFFGAGLTNAGLTGWCGLAKLIAKMPWNQ